MTKKRKKDPYSIFYPRKKSLINFFLAGHLLIHPKRKDNRIIHQQQQTKKKIRNKHSNMFFLHHEKFFIHSIVTVIYGERLEVLNSPKKN